MSKTALITGITGQDGTYLSQLLLSKGYRIHGLSRNPDSDRTKRFLNETLSQFEVSHENLRVHADRSESIDSLREFLYSYQISEIYHLASQSHVGDSFEAPVETFSANVFSTLSLLEAIRTSKSSKKMRFFQAGSAAVFGGTNESPQSESTPFSPRSPYAASKISAHSLVETYREAYGLFACTGILYNHESPKRTPEFVTGKIVDAVARIASGEDHTLTLGNLETGRDWGFAGDFVEAMWLMLQHDTPRDFIIATGNWHSLKEFLEIAFRTVGLDWQDYTTSDPQFFRPTEPIKLVGDPSQIQSQLNWRPSTSFKSMIELMVHERMLELKQQ